MRSVLKGVNAAVVGLLLAALYNPVWTSAIPPWLVVILGALDAIVIAAVV